VTGVLKVYLSFRTHMFSLSILMQQWLYKILFGTHPVWSLSNLPALPFRRIPGVVPSNGSGSRPFKCLPTPNL
jgi:hypothetical protein